MFAPVTETLQADSAVTSLVAADAIFRHADAAVDRTGDYITWSVSAVPENDMSDVPGIDRQTITVNCFSDEDLKVELMAEAARAALEPLAHCIGMPIDNRDRSQSKKYRIALQFDWWYPRA
jgi:hypothetical protein